MKVKVHDAYDSTNASYSLWGSSGLNLGLVWGELDDAEPHMLTQHTGRSIMPRGQPKDWRDSRRIDYPYTTFDNPRTTDARIHCPDTMTSVIDSPYWLEVMPNDWASAISIDNLNTGFKSVVELKSNMVRKPIADARQPHDHLFGLMGNWRGQYRDDLRQIPHELPKGSTAGTNGSPLQVQNTMPLIWERIGVEWDNHLKDAEEVDSIDNVPFTVLQVIGTHQETSFPDQTAYCRLFQPSGASDTDPNRCMDALSSNILLAYTHANVAGCQRGDILVVPIERWNGSGFVLDAVMTSSHSPIEPLVITADSELWNIRTDDVWRFGDVGFVCVERMYGHHEVNSIRSFIHPTKADALNHYTALSIMMSNTQAAAIGDVSESTADQFIPAWKDKRGVLVIDRASPFPAHYHDEIRCRSCNGRVLIKMKADNKISEATCPHCKAAKAITFHHLIQAPAEAVKRVGDPE